MARESHTTLRTVRFYEAEGLISAMGREDGCQRRFAEGELTKLQTIADLREAGLSLHEIKDLIALKHKSSTNACDAAERMSAAITTRLDELDRRAATLQRVRRELAAMACALEVCRGCTRPEFPKQCGECPDARSPEADRPNVLLWRH
jgi:DNA-binding transcriptional MerR regulator